MLVLVGFTPPVAVHLEGLVPAPGRFLEQARKTLFLTIQRRLERQNHRLCSFESTNDCLLSFSLSLSLLSFIVFFILSLSYADTLSLRLFLLFSYTNLSQYFFLSLSLRPSFCLSLTFILFYLFSRFIYFYLYFESHQAPTVPYIGGK